MYLIGTDGPRHHLIHFFYQRKRFNEEFSHTSTPAYPQLPLLLLRRNRSTEKKNRAGACAFHVVYVAARARHTL
jgi:hypothetical protein